MKTKRTGWFLGVTFAILIVPFVQGCARYMEIPPVGVKTPVITQSYAAEQGRYGNILKIYIEADSPDIDMARIATVVYQAGWGQYPTDWIFLKPQYARHFVGYLQWNTYSASTSFLPEWAQITMKVSVLDKAGRESNVVFFPYEFVSGVSHSPPPPAPFDQGNIPMLGHITINLIDPSHQDDNSDRTWQ
jgi:hypothetical protein